MKKRSRKKKPVNGFVYFFLTALFICALTGLILVVFAYFHHVRPVESESLGLVSSRDSVSASSPSPTLAPALTPVPGLTPAPSPSSVASPGSVAQADWQPTAEPTPAVPTAPPDLRVGDFTYRHYGMFTDGEVIRENTENGVRYVSENINLTGIIGEHDRSTYYLADFYIRDIEVLQSALANEKFGMGQRQMPEAIAKKADALIAINGDYYSVRKEGVVLRNGELFRDHQFRDLCVLYWDGTMKTFAKNEITGKEALEDGAYQIWSFGPKLLNEDGSPAKKFNTDVYPRNPRTAIGYFEPGHYCFLVVEGRSDDSKGWEIEVLAQFMSDLGCKQAYNLDGGQTSAMIFDDKVINDRYGGGRSCSDVIMLKELE